MSKVLVLNSGGFDSVCLLSYVYDTEKDCDITAVHFTYGALNEEQQYNCAFHSCVSIGAHMKTVELPKFSWTAGKFYKNKQDKTKDECFLEWRNLVFLSYAISIAESEGCSKIYVAFLKGTYPDTSKEFVRLMNGIIENSSIEIVAPFIDKDKYELIPLAVRYGITRGDYFSCDVPVDGEKCGKCIDCKDLEYIEETLKVDNPYKACLLHGVGSRSFEYHLCNNPVTELRALINNDCQFKCKHCFYGFEDTADDILSPEEYYSSVIKPAVEKLGVKNVHFSGKEPLYDPNILFNILELMKRDGILNKATFNLVTNGVNLTDSVLEHLKYFGISDIFISVDSGVLRNGSWEDALRVCDKASVSVTLFYDLYNSTSVNRLGGVLSDLLDRYKCVDSVFVRTVRSIGNAEDNMSKLGDEDLSKAFSDMNALSDLYWNKHFTLALNIEYLNILGGGSLISKVFDELDKYLTTCFKSNFYVELERYCSRYSHTVSVTPDGYVLGCASEVACKNYVALAIGNVKTEPLAKLVELARDNITVKCNDCYRTGEDFKCSFLYETP